MASNSMIEDIAMDLAIRIDMALHSAPANKMMQMFHGLLANMGIPPPYLEVEHVAISILTFFCTLLLYFIFCGKRHRKRRMDLESKLVEAAMKVQKLRDELEALNLEEERESNSKKEIRVWMDGAFDMMHYGHMNAFRQGRALGTYLVVGVNDDKSITECKGAPPVMNDAERITSVTGCKFVDAVEEHCPYIMNAEYLDRMIKKHKIDYVVHGDDPCIVDGKDVYATAKALGKYRSIPRTEGVSTSDILGRMLVSTKEHHVKMSQQEDEDGKRTKSLHFDRPSKFLTTNRMLRLFSAGNREPVYGKDTIIYIDGAFDMFHSGHVKILKKAKELGSYLIVGIHNDETVNQMRGLNYPIMNLHERVLSVLGCRYVDDVLIDAPWQVTSDMIASLHLDKVVHGSTNDDSLEDAENYHAAIEAGIFEKLQSDSDLTVQAIASRIQQNRERFEKKVVKKMAAESEYYQDRYNADKNDLRKRK